MAPPATDAAFCGLDRGGAQPEAELSTAAVPSAAVLARVAAGLRTLPDERPGLAESGPEDLAVALAPLVRLLLAGNPELGTPDEVVAPTPGAVLVRALPRVWAVRAR